MPALLAPLRIAHVLLSLPPDEEKEFEKYCKLYEETFGKKVYIAEPSVTRKQTIEAIKICLKENKDMLDELLYLNTDKFIY